MSKKPTKNHSPETKIIRELARILDDENLSAIEMEKGDLRLRVTRQLSGGVPVAALAAPSLAQPVAAAPPLETKDTNPADEAGAVTSPMVGTVYVRSSPDADAFFNVGDTIKAGETVLLIEAMKTFNPIKAPNGGTLTKILVEDGQPVEFGEALLVIS
ncbi:MAG: acetyl-CoA carboxylase biotin carboxyl carrier protein subunit [Robiginitomaculum sp.]|nr:MAG: acetyl-CoA carboxylase biotin carboxyl carrier protein subunit [Robiginitomaculum sp.]